MRCREKREREKRERKRKKSMVRFGRMGERKMGIIGLRIGKGTAG
jgi:hypothetical protein